MRIRLILSLTLALSFSAYQAAKAVSDMDVTASTELRLLELKYFEHTFDNESSQDRVERIERLVRGEVAEGSPQDRIKKIAAALQADGQSLGPDQSEPVKRTKNNTSSMSGMKTPAAADDNNEASDSTSSADTGDYPKISNLEKEILRQTFAGQALTERLARLETKAFGSPTRSSDLGARTDRLETYAEQTLHDKPFGVNPEIDKPYVLGSAPASASGMGAQQAIEHFFNTNRRLSDEFSGRQSLNPALSGEPGQPAQSSEFSQASQLDDDPLAYAKDPPPPDTRMLTRVAWCEVQIFGHTFPNMHLTRRLRQLGDELIPKIAKQSDMQLMDDLDPIEKAVIARKAGQSISSGSAPGVR